MHKSKIAAVAGVVVGVVGLPSTALAAGEVVCTVDDPRAVELSGLVATADGYVSIVDSQFDTASVVIVYLDQACRVVRTARPTGCSRRWTFSGGAKGSPATCT